MGTVLDVNGWTPVYVMVAFDAEPGFEEPCIRTYDLEAVRPVDAAA